MRNKRLIHSMVILFHIRHSRQFEGEKVCVGRCQEISSHKIFGCISKINPQEEEWCDVSLRAPLVLLNLVSKQVTEQKAAGELKCSDIWWTCCDPSDETECTHQCVAMLLLRCSVVHFYSTMVFYYINLFHIFFIIY